jgi:carbamoyltransferase
MHVARSIQDVTDEIMLRLALHARAVTDSVNLCLAGGVALNCVANGLMLRNKVFENLWIQPAAGDAGGALGAALALWYNPSKVGGANASKAAKASGAFSRTAERNGDQMKGAFLGPEFSDAEIETTLKSHGAIYTRLDDEGLLRETVALLMEEKVVGWVQGRMEFGPRALGNRSILGDARSPRMQSVMNLKVKFRESFRPFAPAVRRERVSDYFELDSDSPYMLLVAPVRESLRLPIQNQEKEGLERLKELRSSIPAVTHVDYSARVQTVSREQNPRFHALLERFESATGCGVLVNTSFNVRGEPIVCTPDDAYRCFVNTEMDYLVIGNFLLERTVQPRAKPAQRFDKQDD